MDTEDFIYSFYDTLMDMGGNVAGCHMLDNNFKCRKCGGYYLPTARPQLCWANLPLDNRSRKLYIDYVQKSTEEE